jgi:hypothetical protein
MRLTETVSQIFHCCDKIPDTKELKGRNFYFNSWFQKFQSIDLSFIDSGSMVRQSIMAAGACGRGYSP